MARTAPQAPRCKAEPAVTPQLRNIPAKHPGHAARPPKPMPWWH